MAQLTNDETSTGNLLKASLGVSQPVVSRIPKAAENTNSDVAGARSVRLPAVDFTKGALVLVMVLYHWLNYFVGAEGYFYRYLGFLPPSFICITGFLVSYVYLSKYRVSDRDLPRRLAVRGLKILGIFIVLNLTIGLFVPRFNVGKTGWEMFSPATLWAIFVSGNMRGARVVAFYVLVPISYLLLLSSGLLIVSRYSKYIFHVATGLALLGILALNVAGDKSQNLELLFIGSLGISIGYIPVGRLNRFLKYPYLVVIAYLFYVTAITLWNIPYPLQVAGVLLTLMLTYMVGTASGDSHRIPGTLILLGRYSLFGYIAQIALLQIMRRLLGGSLPLWALLLSFLGALALTVFSVETVDRIRARVPIVNRVYGLVFS